MRSEHFEDMENKIWNDEVPNSFIRFIICYI